MTIVSEACATATPDPRHETATAGFTLVEVLVALILVAVMSSLMVVFIGQAGALVRIDSASEAETEVNAAVRFLETTIANAEPLPLLPSNPDQVHYLQGAVSEIQLNAIQPVGFGTNALRQIAIGLRKPVNTATGTRYDLVLANRTRRVQAEDPKKEVLLLADVTGLSFEYLENTPDGLNWLPTWQSLRRLPLAVRIRLEILRGGKAYSSNGLVRLDLATTDPQRSENSGSSPEL